MEKLAHAREEEVLKLWQGLGYYSRARNLHHGALFIVNNLNGKFPGDYNGWLKIKGVGPYSAAAIVSFANNLPHAVVDGNVYRVLSRYFGYNTPIDSTEGKKIFAQLANELISKKNAALFNQSIMDLGATVCLPKQPFCKKCPFTNTCYACNNNAVSVFPVKGKRKALQLRTFLFLVDIKLGRYAVEKRTDQDIWRGLYQFPLVEGEVLTEKGIEKTLKKKFKRKTFKIIFVSEIFEQKLTHQHLKVRFIHGQFHFGDEFRIIRKHVSGLKKLPVPKMISDYLKNNIH